MPARSGGEQRGLARRSSNDGEPEKDTSGSPLRAALAMSTCSSDATTRPASISAAMASISRRLRRQFSGTRVAPKVAQANRRSTAGTPFAKRPATRSPRLTPNRERPVASRDARSASSAYVKEWFRSVSTNPGLSGQRPANSFRFQGDAPLLATAAPLDNGCGPCVPHPRGQEQDGCTVVQQPKRPSDLQPHKLIGRLHVPVLLEIDGGIGPEKPPQTLVHGSLHMHGNEDIDMTFPAALQRLRRNPLEVTCRHLVQPVPHEIKVRHIQE